MELITKRYFKIEEANSLIPKLSKILIQIMKINNHLSMINSISVDYEDELKSIIHTFLQQNASQPLKTLL